MARDNNRLRNCPACGAEMTPVKNAPLKAGNPPAFSCHGCGVTAFGDSSPNLNIGTGPYRI